MHVHVLSNVLSAKERLPPHQIMEIESLEYLTAGGQLILQAEIPRKLPPSDAGGDTRAAGR